MTRGELEYKLIEAELRLRTAQYAEALWKLPLIGNGDVPAALGISQTTWQVMKLEGITPPCVMFGARVFYRPSDLREWLRNLQAKKNPGLAGVSEEPVETTLPA